jgi:hypothetical protein
VARHLLSSALAAATLATLVFVAPAAAAQFGIQTEGSEAFSVVVSNSAIPDPLPEAHGMMVANPNDLDTQAGSHPYDVTQSFFLKPNAKNELPAELLARDISVNLPPGASGSITSVPQCPMADLASEGVGCPTSSQVGLASVFFIQSTRGQSERISELAPVYNMVPADGGTAELSFPVLTIAQPIIVSVRTDGNYGLTAQTRNISESLRFDGLTLTLWGVPADPRHDSERFAPQVGSVGLQQKRPGGPNGEPLPDSAPLTGYFTNPTQCSGPVYATIDGDSWANPGPFAADGRPELSGPNWVTASTAMYPDGVTGCNRLRFNPSIEVTPDTAKADSPSGYAIALRVPQSTNPNDLVSSALKDATATLPQGLAINPGAADGLQACTDNLNEPPGSPGNEIGLTSNEPVTFASVEPTCPTASQVGTTELKTPVLPEPLVGQIYLSADHAGDEYTTFFVIRGEGLLIKLKSVVTANPVTGQLTARFTNNPEQPFSEFTIHFYGGPRAVFVNPEKCGLATTSTDLTPWAAGPGGLGDATPLSTFGVSFDGFGALCPEPQPFAPSFAAGTTSIQAGGFSPLTTVFSRPDEDQKVDHVQLTAPPGLLGTLRSVSLCPEPQASEGDCPESSLLGHTIIGVGSGAAPLYLPVAGQPPNPVYVTGPYHGAPYGLTFVVPAVAGPYNLGKVVVRAAITVNPSTAALTVTGDPLPTILDGIPVQVKSVDVVIDRANFMFNPTDCEPQSISGTVTSLQGATTTLTSPFQVTGCGDLKFKPEFSVSTSGHTSRADGASIDARLSFPAGALGHQANIAQVKVELPKQLPSRLATLQKACAAQVFEANPANCPAASVIGVVRASTQVLTQPLSGPVYFVSHGGEAFPSLVVVLQGGGVRVDLTGATFISKAGITSTTFKTIPDVPVESFELYLPEGPYSALAAHGNLCKSSLVMPTTFTAQNGIVLHQKTPIAVTGCKATAGRVSRARAARRHRRHDTLTETAHGVGRAGIFNGRSGR